MEKVLVVTPYVNAAQGRELELSIIGWNRFFRTPFQRIVIGDVPSWADRYPEVQFIRLPRVDGLAGMYRPHLDMAAKFLHICDTFPEYRGFIRVADDCYPLNPFTLRDVSVLKMQSPSFSGEKNSANGWRHDKWRTRKLLDSNSLPHRNFTIHSPMWYDMRKLSGIIHRYDLIHNSFVIEDLYFNTFHPEDEAVLLDYTGEHYRAIVNTSEAYHAAAMIREAISDGKLWAFNTTKSYSQSLEKTLFDYYANSKNAVGH